MKEERKLARDDKELDLKDLFVEVLIHWKGIIIAALIGGLALGGYSYYSSYKENKIQTEKKAVAEAIKQSQTENREALDNELRMSELEGALSETSKSNVKSVLTYSEQVARYEDYMTHSVFMLVDEKEIPKGTVSFYVVSGNDDSAKIAGAYKGILSSSDLLEYVKKQCNIGTEVSEQIIVGKDQDKLSDEEETITVSVYGISEDQCSEIIKSICDYAGKKCAELQALLGEHSLVVLDSSVAQVYEKKRIDDKIALQNTVINLKKQISTAKESFTADEMEYFNILQDKIKTEITNESLRDSIPEEEEIVIPPVEVNKKKLLIGIAGGMVLYIFILCIVYFFSRKIKDSDDFESLVRVPQLGKVYRYRNYKGLTKKIYSIKFAGRKVPVPAEAEAIISDNVAAVAEKESVKKLGVIVAEGTDNLMDGLNSAASQKSIEVISISDVLCSRDQMNKLDSIDAVLLIAKPMVSKYDDIYDVVNVLDNRGIKILGGVMD